MNIFYFKGNEVEVVTYQKYLGTYFSNRLSWTKTLQIRAAQARKASFSIHKYQYEFGHFNPTDAFSLQYRGRTLLTSDQELKPLSQHVANQKFVYLIY